MKHQEILKRVAWKDLKNLTLKAELAKRIDQVLPELEKKQTF